VDNDPGGAVQVSLPIIKHHRSGWGKLKGCKLRFRYIPQYSDWSQIEWQVVAYDSRGYFGGIAKWVLSDDVSILGVELLTEVALAMREYGVRCASRKRTRR
jgi:hypothetical protein